MKQNGFHSASSHIDILIDEMGDEHVSTSVETPLRSDAFDLSDEEKIAALTLSADARGLQLSTGVIPYLLTHFRRDMQSLSAMLNALDRYSLETN